MLNEAITAWYGGCQKYNFKNPSWQQGCGNFTQLVWAESKEVGVGAAESKIRFLYVLLRALTILKPPGPSFFRESFTAVFDPNSETGK